MKLLISFHLGRNALLSLFQRQQKQQQKKKNTRLVTSEKIMLLSQDMYTTINENASVFIAFAIVISAIN